MVILVTGGAGYIGSHTAVALLDAGFEVVVVDNLVNANTQVLERILQITGKKVDFYQQDVRDFDGLSGVFEQHKIDAVVHFAGLKAVGESVKSPLAYYDNNVAGTLNLCEVMNKFSCKTLVFSSSATVYGKPDSLPIFEDFPTSATNPYGQSKLMIEQILADIYAADNSWKIARLRYFNPVGAHQSGLIGEDPLDVPNNLLPYISQVAIGKLDKLLVFGDDYETPDGTGVRDYIHVLDLAAGHIKALQFLAKKSGILTVNLGTGQGISVLEMIKAFEIASGKTINFEVVARRPGDIDACYADVSLAKKLLGWEANLDLAAMCADAWRWQEQNPRGYL